MAKKVQKKGSSKRSAPRSSRRAVGIRRDMPIAEVLQSHPETLAVFAAVDLSCLGDRREQVMTVEYWALEHGVDVKKFLLKLNSSASKRHNRAGKKPAHRGL